MRRLGCTRRHTGSENLCIAGIGALTNLRELRVSGNKLSSLSAEVGSLRKLHRLIADNNLLTSIPGGSIISAHLTRNTMRLVLVLQGCVTANMKWQNSSRCPAAQVRMMQCSLCPSPCFVVDCLAHCWSMPRVQVP